MPQIKWTSQQLEAIEHSDKAVLVSAAAGSGKTAVIVERIIRLVCDPVNPVDIDKFLVVTFTNAAAAEMKEKIIDAIFKKLSEFPNNKHLIRQINLIGKAKICTIHSFCLNVIKKYFYKLDIGATFRVGDTTEIDLIKSEVLLDLIEDKYNSEDDEFLRVIESFCGTRNDKEIFKLINQITNTTASLAQPGAFYKKAVENLDEAANLPVFESYFGKIMVEYAKKKLNVAKTICERSLDIIYNDEALTPYISAYLSDYEAVKLFLQSLDGDFDTARELFLSFEMQRRNQVKGYDDISTKNTLSSYRDTVKDIILSIKENLFALDTNDVHNEYKIQKDLISKLFSLSQEFLRRFSEIKREKGILDYNDLERFAYNLLVKSYDSESKAIEVTDEAIELSSQFSYVFIDEYQDTNELQDVIFRSITDISNNLFAVGDIKQSIYRFRHANPNIFLQRKESNTNAIKLNSNFRSRNSIILAINYIFSLLMNKGFGDVDYSQGEELAFGASYEGKDSPVCVDILDLSEESNSLDEENIELEAKIVAKRINELIANKTELYDTKKKILRPITYNDIVILLRNEKNKADKFEKIFSKAGIPCYFESSQGYFTCAEVELAMSLLRAIDNPTAEVYLTSVMMSPIFGFSAEELLSIKSNSKDSFYECVINNKDNEKVKNMLFQLERFRMLAKVLPIDELIFTVFEETSLFSIVLHMNNGSLRKNNLLLLYDYAKQFENTSFKGLYNFILYVDKIIEQDGDLASAKKITEGFNAVKIMSIHKSKGLEFPVVFLSSTATEINKNDYKNPLAVSADFGAACKIRDQEKLVDTTTLAREAIFSVARDQALSEELRVLYVALTRPKERLYITMVQKNLQSKLLSLLACISKDGKLNTDIVKDQSSYSEFILSALLISKDADELKKIYDIKCPNSLQSGLFNINVINSKFFDSKIKEKTLKKEQSIESLDLLSEIKNRLDFCYNNGNSDVPAKISVSELAKDGGSYIQKQPLPKFLSKTIASSAQKGTAIHNFLQYCDYNNIVDKKSIEKEIERLILSEFITKEQANFINVDTIMTFVNSDLFNLIINAKDYIKEKRFTVLLPANKLLNNITVEEVLLQGVIDCMIIDDDGIIVIDYKTDKASEEELINRYQNQLNVYETAITEIYKKEVKQKIIYSFHLSKSINI